MKIPMHYQTSEFDCGPTTLLNAPIFLFERKQSMGKGGIKADIEVRDGDTLTVGDINMRFIDTPGHTPGGMCVYIESEGVLFSGMITTTCDFDDADLFTVTYRVGDQVRKGDKLTFRVVPTTFLVGDDSSGKHTKDYCAMLEKASVTVTVK